MSSEGIERAAGILAGCRRPVAFTGAGMSRESGIRTFRGKDGYWRQYRAEDLASLQAVRTDPDTVWEWYAERLLHNAEVKPHPGYFALVDIESSVGSLPVITQNVDGLHSRAGSEEVVELHGSLRTASCLEEPGRSFPITPEMLEDLPPRCPCGAVLRPDVVLFGEPLPAQAVDRAVDLARSCDLMLVVGTSMVVYPAAALPYRSLRDGASVVEINTAPTPLTDEPGVLSLRGPAGEVLPELYRVAWGGS
jgi:NAD-dependent deacetylase